MTTASGGYVTEMPAAAAAAAAASSGSGQASSSPSSSSPSSSEGGGANRNSAVTSPSHASTVCSATSISVTNSSPSPLLTIVPAVHGSPVRDGSASPCESGGDVSVGGVGVTTAQLTAQVVVTTTSSGAVTTSSSSVSVHKGAVLPADSPHLIIGPVSEGGEGSLDSTAGVGLHGAYVQYVDASPDPLYSSTNGQM